MKVRLLLAALGALAVFAVGTGGATAGDNPKAKSETLTADCIGTLSGQDEGDITFTGPTSVWPPNHKYVTAIITVTDVDNPDPPDGGATDDSTASVTGSHNQMLEDG